MATKKGFASHIFFYKEERTKIISLQRTTIIYLKKNTNCINLLLVTILKRERESVCVFAMPSNNKKNKNKSKGKKKALASSEDKIPLECTNDEFQDLLMTAQSLTLEEARLELMDCARYGEIDAVRAILDVWSSEEDSIINVKDESGSTALHKSAANNHVSTTRLLLARGAVHTTNSNGNTPLHWAAAAGHYDIVQLLLNDKRLTIDVLQKNNFGRSALTEGFSSQKTEVAGLLLEHDSAEEDKLINGGGTCKEVAQDEDNNEKQEHNIVTTSGNDGGADVSLDQHIQNSETCVDNASVSTSGMGVTHEFDLLQDGCNIETSSSTETTSISLLIRELPIQNADNPFGDKDIEDTTGLGIWCASIVMARWMASADMSCRFQGKNLLELGAGCAIPGLAAAMYSDARCIYLTDLNPVTMNNLQYNIDINADHYSTQHKGNATSLLPWVDRVKPMSIDWGDETTWPDEKIDFVLGSDLIYQKSIVPLLKNVVDGLLNEDGSFLYVCPEEGARDGLIEFIKAMSQEGFKCVGKDLAPPLFKSNPLASGDEEEAFLHFHELSVNDYRLYEFRRC